MPDSFDVRGECEPGAQRTEPLCFKVVFATALGSQISISAHRTAGSNLLIGTGPLCSLRKACAFFTLPSTAESRLFDVRRSEKDHNSLVTNSLAGRPGLPSQFCEQWD